MRRIAALLVTALSMATVLSVTPAQASPVCGDPLGVCDTLCRWHIVC